jgi:hypothetical protein
MLTIDALHAERPLYETIAADYVILEKMIDDAPTAKDLIEAIERWDELRRRLYEVEERMDFSERLLVARPADVARTDAPDA